MKNIRLICFDLDDTLWPCMPTIIKAEKILYNWLETNKPFITKNYSIEQLREKRLALAKNQPEISHNLTALRKASFHELAREFDDHPDWVLPAFEVFYEARQNVSFYDDVEEVLTQLNQKYTLAAMTNGNADIYRTALGSLFQYSISAEDVGAAKPDAKMFNALIEQTGIPATDILYIGDHPIQDIEGAEKTGITNVWLNRDKLEWPHQTLKPNHVAYNLYQVLTLFEPESIE